MSEEFKCAESAHIALDHLAESTHFTYFSRWDETTRIPIVEFTHIPLFDDLKMLVEPGGHQ